jgi:hypothetical protein
LLYKLQSTAGKFDKLEPIAFKDFSFFGNLEKDLEDLIAKNILEVLFEEASLMPIFQERQYQSEADVYALNEKGELVIFELKRAQVGESAVHQALSYAQDAGQWSYYKIESKFHDYTGEKTSLNIAHQEAFNLEHALEPSTINNKQHLIIIGSAVDDKLINVIDYWKKQGISIEFLPYRVYELGEDKYFEFFAMPYDKHRNPSDLKGVFFDTNRSWDEESIWYMMENKRVAAFGDAKRFVEYVYPGDIVFFSHKWTGIIAAARVKSNVKAPDDETLYRDVDFLTPVPIKGGILKAMPFGKVTEFIGQNFFWARTIKVPYLSKEEADSLVGELIKYLS